MRFISLASSSKANCYVVEHNGAALLVDAGLKKRDMLARLREVDITFSEKEAEGSKGELVYVNPLAILISHHHSDHAGRAGEISLSLEIPLYCSPGTLEASPPSLLSKPKQGMVQTFPLSDFFLGDFEVQPVTTYHTPGAVGFLISAAERNLSVFTDVAELSGGVAEAYERSHMICSEADYSEAMLDGCEYAPELKRRIRISHTSNEKLAAFFSNGFKGAALHSVVLLHTSRSTNCGFIAGAKVTEALEKQFPQRSIKVWVAAHDDVTGPLDV